MHISMFMIFFILAPLPSPEAFSDNYIFIYAIMAPPHCQMSVRKCIN